MFGFEKRFGSKKAETPEVPPIEDEVTEVDAENYNVDTSRRNFLRQGLATAATAGMAAAGITPEAAEAAETNIEVEQVGLTLTNHQLLSTKMKVKKMFPDAVSVEVRLVSSEGAPLTSIRVDVLTKEGKSFTEGAAGHAVADTLPLALEMLGRLKK